MSRIAELQAPVVQGAQVSVAQRLTELSYPPILDSADGFEEDGQPLRFRHRAFKRGSGKV